MTISEKRKILEGMDLDWIRQQMEIKGVSQRDLGAAIGLSDAKISNVLRGARQLKASEADGIRRFFGYRLPEDRNPIIAVIGKVGAGDHVLLADDFEKGGGLYHIERPRWLPDHGVGAAEIDGSSGEPFALNGDIVFWRRDAIAVLPEDLGRPVVAELSDGTVVLKRLAAGSAPGKWTLLSLNPTHPNLVNVEVVWASRVMAPLSKDDVRLARVS